LPGGDQLSGGGTAMAAVSRWAAAGLACLALAGCAKNRFSITAVPLSPMNQCEPEGIPYYLPKPLLVVAKNVRHIDEAKVGLTDPVPIPNAFDSQGAYADLKANVTVPAGGATTSLAAANTGAGVLPSAFDANRGGIPAAALQESMIPGGRMEDGIAPDSFYSYQIIFVPDLSQKYGLRIKGGTGEVRAAMNMVNGWMYTGMGPFYIKDSSTAQNLMAFGAGSLYAGRGVADVLNEVSDLASLGAGGAERGADNGLSSRKTVDAEDFIDRATNLARVLQSEVRVPQVMQNFAEIHIYEPSLTPDGSMCWNIIASHSFDRQYFQPAMDKEAVSLFQNILQHDAQIRQLPKPPPAGTQNTIEQDANPERAEDDLTSPGFNPGNQNRGTQLPPANGAQTGRVILPATPYPPSSGTNIDVNVDTGNDHRLGGLLPGLLHKPSAERPKFTTRLNSGTARLSDTGGGTTPGGTQSSGN